MTPPDRSRAAFVLILVAAVALTLSVRQPSLQAVEFADNTLLATVSAGATDAARGADSAPTTAAAPLTLDWRVLARLDYVRGVIAPELRQLDGRMVRIPGYIVPLDDYADAVTEFLLVPYFGACIHTPPPPPNQMVHATMTRSKKISPSIWRPVWLEGRLSLKPVDSPYGVVAYRLHAERVSPYTAGEQ